MISFSAAGSVFVSDALPDDIESEILGIITEGGAATQIAPGTWVCSISTFNVGKGYWAITNTNIIFSFDLSNIIERM